MFNHRGQTRFMAVRFGNVLGSRGSVVPIFQDQIKRGGPVTVRGPQVRRYFMATSEAVLLVLQAATIGRGGEVFVLDMGQPIKVADLARELIRLSGLEPDRDIPIVFTKLEPGEKEFEDILTAEEGTEATQHEQIHVAHLSSAMTDEALLSHVAELCQAAEQGSPGRIIGLLKELVPTYSASPVAAGHTMSALQPHDDNAQHDAKKYGDASGKDSVGNSPGNALKAAP
jgi:FlaA1/EpsC-like NDP-sugar epimerase